MLYSKTYLPSIFAFLFFVCSNAYAGYSFTSLNGCVLEVKDWGTMGTELADLKEVTNLQVNETKKSANLIYKVTGQIVRVVSIEKLKVSQIADIKTAYLECVK